MCIGVQVDFSPGYWMIQNIAPIYFLKRNSSATKTPSHKEKIRISKRFKKSKNLFLKKSDDAFLVSNIELSKYLSAFVSWWLNDYPETIL
jgi:hypothetical protein